MTRRKLLFGLIPAAASAVQTWGNVNGPACPVCREPIPADHPVLHPVVAVGSDISTMDAMDDIMCVRCGVRFVVRGA